MQYGYNEPQVQHYCAKHALNHIFQCPLVVIRTGYSNSKDPDNTSKSGTNNPEMRFEKYITDEERSLVGKRLDIKTQYNIHAFALDICEPLVDEWSRLAEEQAKVTGSHDEQYDAIPKFAEQLFRKFLPQPGTHSAVHKSP